MTLRLTIRSFLQYILDCLKYYRDYFGNLNEKYKLEYQKEKEYQRLLKERKDREKQWKKERKE